MIIATTPSIVETPIGALRRYTRKPKAIATTMKSNDTIATEAFVATTASPKASPLAFVVPNVPATIEAKAATTRISVR